MWVLGIGTEITEVTRIARMIADHGEQFLERIFTPEEIRYCQSRKSNERFASLWSAKEAVLKAIGGGLAWGQGLTWTDIEVHQVPGQGPQIRLAQPIRDLVAQRGVHQILISISHTRHYAVAYALASGIPPGLSSL